jgi:hypothetical protein
MSLIQVTLSVIACIVGSGVLGGLIGWLGEDTTANNKNASAKESGAPKSCLYYLLLSIGAATTVPLFLTLIQSKISANVFSTGDAPKLEDWFVFFGLCVIAAIFAKNYLETLYGKLLDRLNKTDARLNKTKATADATKGRVDEIAENRLQEGEPIEDTVSSPVKKGIVAELTSSPSPIPPSNLTDAEKKVWAALIDPTFPRRRRSLEGIVSDTKLDLGSAQSVLNKLKAANLVEEVHGERTDNVYYRWLGAPSPHRGPKILGDGDF